MTDNHMLLETNEPRFIVIEGPIGVGKTSLATRLARTFNSDLILEKAEDNPFLERFYRDPRRAALPTQLFFFVSAGTSDRAVASSRSFFASPSSRFFA